MNFDHLLYFKEAAEKEHIHLAARSLKVSPSAVVHAIRNLEGEMGCRLFRKEGRNIRLEPFGVKLLEGVSGVLEQVLKLKESVQKPGDLQGFYRVGATHGMASDYVAKACAKLQKMHGGILFEVISLRSGDVLEMLRRDAIDLGFCYNPQAVHDLQVQFLRGGHLTICARRGHALHRVTQKSRGARLQDFPAALPKVAAGIEDCRNHPIFAKWKLTPQVVFTYDNYDVCAQYLRYSDAWSLLPHWIVIKHRATLREVMSDAEASVQVAALWRGNRTLPRGAALLVEQVDEMLH